MAGRLARLVVASPRSRPGMADPLAASPHPKLPSVFELVSFGHVSLAVILTFLAAVWNWAVFGVMLQAVLAVGETVIWLTSPLHPY